MIKNLTSSHLLLITIASLVLLLAAFSFFLLLNPTAPLPFALLPATRTSTPPPPSETYIQPTATDIPTRQTSYTPFASLLTPSSSNPSTPNPSQSVTPGSVTPSKNPTQNTSLYTPSLTTTPPTPTISPSPTITGTLALGEHAVTGRVLQNGTPVANVLLEFADDVTPRKAGTDNTGHYWFTTLAPGTSFSLTFKQSDNPLLAPAAQIASLASIRGTLPTNINIIDLPDLEISLNLNGTNFKLQVPTDGATYSASVISQMNRIQFIWTPYNQAESYHVELGAYGSQDPIWISDQRIEIYYMWDGTLNDGGHISQGTYWWRVGVSKSIENYEEVIFTQPWDILFDP